MSLWLLISIKSETDEQVLLQKGCTELVERGRQVTTTGGKTKQLGKLLGKPLSKFSTVCPPPLPLYLR
jgi:hypothetical protein